MAQIPKAGKPRFTASHHDWLADKFGKTFRNIPKESQLRITRDFCQWLKMENPNFNELKFRSKIMDSNGAGNPEKMEF